MLLSSNFNEPGFHLKTILEAIYLLICLVIICPLFSKAQPASQEAVICGKTNIVWSHSISVADKIIPLSDSGSFYLRMKLSGQQLVSLSHESKKIDLILLPEDSVYISLDAEEIDMSGSNAALNKALLKHTNIARQNSSFLDIHNKSIFSLEPSLFKAKIDSLTNVELQSLKEFQKSNTRVHKEIYSRLAADILYRSKFYQLLYPHNYNRHTGKIPAVKADYFAKIAKDTFKAPELLGSEAYVRYVNFYLDVQAAGKYQFMNLESAPIERVNSRYKAINDLQAGGAIKDFFLGQHFKRALENYSPKALTSCFNRVEKDCKNAVIKEQIRAIYDRAMEQRKQADAIKIYKRVGDIDLEAHIFYPKGYPKTDKRAAYLFFHGGGWAIGKPEWGYDACKRFSSKGMIAISFAYRLRNVHGTHIAESVQDALWAMSWVREHAHELGIDSDKLVAAGFSAGAHLAACTAMVRDAAGIGSKPVYSYRPSALILQSCPYDINGRDAANAFIAPERLSPLYLIDEQIVPTLAFHGKNDEMVNYSEFESFVEKMKKANTLFNYRAFEGVGHFFYDPAVIKFVDEMTDTFLKSVGYL